VSDREVLESICAMEGRLDGDPSGLDAAALEAWNQEFRTVVASAERGPEWPAILERAHRLSARIQTVVAGLDRKRAALKEELRSQNLGQRALKAYGASS
jgi:hypothetical protein